MFRLSDEQTAELEPFVKDRSILDLGAGWLEGSRAMLELGARDVLAVDRHSMPAPGSSAITTRTVHFADLEETRPVILASWIVNWPVDIERHLMAAELVISVSKNTDGASCGYPQMWNLLRKREILLYLPERQNTLTVYGPKEVHRSPVGEELAATWPDHMRMFSFEEAEKLAQENPVGAGGILASGT